MFQDRKTAGYLTKSAIKPWEIRQVKEETQIGERIRVIMETEDEGKRLRRKKELKVTGKAPFLCVMENMITIPWRDIVMYFRTAEPVVV